MKCTTVAYWLIRSDQITACFTYLNLNCFQRMGNQYQSMAMSYRSIGGKYPIDDNWNGFCVVFIAEQCTWCELEHLWSIRLYEMFLIVTSCTLCIAAVVLCTKTMSTILTHPYNLTIKTVCCMLLELDAVCADNCLLIAFRE